MRVSYLPSDLDIERVASWLSNQAYWSIGRDFQTVQRSFERSVPISVIADDGRFVGVGRLVTDGCTFGWLCDVFVEPELRGNGIGHLIAKAAVDYFADQKSFRLLLKTRDAQPVYRDVGFQDLENPTSWMAIEQGF